MTSLWIAKGLNRLLLDQNGDSGFIMLDREGGGYAMMLTADELAELGARATSISRKLKREEAYRRLG